MRLCGNPGGARQMQGNAEVVLRGKVSCEDCQTEESKYDIPR